MDEPLSFESAGLMPVKDLFTRYQLAKSVIYKRLKDLSIKPRKIGVRAFVNQQQLALLDEHHEFIQGGGSTAEFLFYKQNQSDDDDADASA